MYWDETLDLEMSDIIDQCSKSDTDFEFVIDQSGSGMVFLPADFVRRFCPQIFLSADLVISVNLCCNSAI